MSEDVANFIRDLSQKEFVVFAGAGVVQETGLPPSWRNLLEAFAAEATSEVGNLDEIEENEYPDVAQRVFDKLLAQGKRDRYHEVLRNRLRTTNTDYSSCQLDIVDTARHVVTTNFDDTFEHALKRVLEWNQGEDWATQSLPELRVNSLAKRYSVSYLHGRVNEECLVFKRGDYQSFYPSQFDISDGCDNLERFLRHIYEEHTIVFVGFSFWDKCFVTAIKEVHKDLERNDVVGKVEKPSYSAVLDKIQHYALLPEPDFKDERKLVTEIDKFAPGSPENVRARRIIWFRQLEELLPALNIKILPYKQHKEWPAWFKQIREQRREPRTVLEQVSLPFDLKTR